MHYRAHQGLDMKKTAQNNEKGFILVTVMLLTMVGGTVVLTSLKDSTVQERLSGNYQKKMNSRLMAEKGVYASLQTMQQKLEENSAITIEELVAATNGMTDPDGDNNSNYGIVVQDSTTDSSLASDEISVASTGTMYEGQAQLKAVYALTQSGSGSTFPFAKGVSACDGVTVSGGSTIDSYDSTYGDYDPNNSNDEVTVQTLFSGSVTFTGGTYIDGDIVAADDVIFQGGADITGNINGNGDLYFGGSTTIGGDVAIRGNYDQSNGSVGGSIQANGYIELAQTIVGGNVVSLDTITSKNNTISGYLLASGDVTLSQAVVNGGVGTYANYTQTGGTVSGGVRVVGDVTLDQSGSNITDDDLRYSGAGSFVDDYTHYSYAPYKQDSAPTLPEVPTVEELVFEDEEGQEYTTCDPFDIATEVLGLSAEATDALDLSISGTGGSDPDGDRPDGFNSGNVYELGKYQSSYVVYNINNVAEPEPVMSKSVYFMDQRFDMLMFNNIALSGHLKIQENQDVTMYVDGDFTTSGSGSITIPDGSSLTLIIKGKLEIGSGIQIFTPDNGVTDSNLPVFAIYSSYEGEGITIDGGTDEIYASVYAPLTDVTITSHNSFKGAVFGKTVTLSGSGDIHYDEALGSAGLGKDADEQMTFVFKGWEYVTEDETSEEEESNSDG